MRTYRIVYIDDDTFAPRTLTAAFASRAAAEGEMAKHGHRVVHIAETRAGERATDPVRVEIAGDPNPPHEEACAARQTTRRTARVALARHSIAGLVAAIGIVAAGAAYLVL